MENNLNPEVQKLIEELQLQRTELERQNEELRKARAKAMERELELTALFDLLPVGITVLDSDRHIIEMNAAIQPLLDLTKDDLQSEKYLHRSYLNSDSQLLQTADFPSIRAVKEGRVVYDVEIGILKEDGKIIWTNVSAAPLPDGKVVLVTTDITDRKLLRISLQESQEKLQSIIQSQSEGIGVVDQNEVFEFVNLAAAEIFETDITRLLGASLTDFLIPAEKEKINKQTTERKTGVTGSYDLQIITKKGNARYIQVSTTPKLDAHGNFLGAYGVFREITKQKQAELILEARLRLAEFAPLHSRYELQQKLLDELEILTGSQIGFFHAVHADQKTITLQSWSTNTLNVCKADGRGQQRELSDSGVWVDCVYQGKPVIHNDYQSLPNRKGLPEGHASIQRQLLVPVFRNNLIQAIVGVGNKLTDYKESDIEIVTRLTDLAWDITERKGAEEQFFKLTQAVEQSPVMTIITDLNGIIEYVNPKATELTGYNREELIGKNPRIIKSGEKSKEEYATLWQTIISGKEWKGEFYNKKKNGEFYWAASSISPVMDTSGKVTHYLAVQEDISNRKKADADLLDLNNSLEQKILERTSQLAATIEKLNKEVADRTQAEEKLQKLLSLLKESEMRFSLFMDYLPALAFIKNSESRIIFANNSMDVALGASNWIGMPLAEVFGAEEAERIYTDDRKTFLNGYQKIDESFPNLDGKIHQYETQKFVIPIPDQKPLLGGIAIDITGRKKAEQEIEIARSEAEQANMAKSEFLSRMSHELRTPMNSILGFAQLMEMGDLNPAQKKGVSHILKSGRHLLNLINEVLDISRIETGQLTLEMEPLQLNVVLMEIADIIQPQAEGLQIGIEIIDSPSNFQFVKADKQRLKQVLINLFNNAIKYNKPGGSIIISTETRHQNRFGFDTIRISITDTGQGISKENIPKLFNPFERLGADNTETEGTGLGLSIVKRLISAMNGNAGVESKLGEGSTFWIELPMAENQNPRVEPSIDLNILATEVPTQTGTILYIEDNIPNIELAQHVLSRQRPGIRMIVNSIGRNAVPLAVEYLPDLILLDLDLPDIHGSEVMANLQANENTKSIPVVIISADAMQSQIDRLLIAGAKSYLTKPIDLLMFLKMVDEWI